MKLAFNRKESFWRQRRNTLYSYISDSLISAMKIVAVTYGPDGMLLTAVATLSLMYLYLPDIRKEERRRMESCGQHERKYLASLSAGRATNHLHDHADNHLRLAQVDTMMHTSIALQLK